MFYTGFDINHLSSPIYYYRSNDKIGVVEFYDLMLNDYYSTPLADFAYFNSPVNFTFLLENEQIQLHLRDTVYKVSEKGKISLNFNHQPSVSDGSFIRIECIDIGDTTIFEFNDYMSYSGNVRASLTIDNHGKLVLVDSTAFYLELESPDNYEGFFSARFGDEKSTIWQKGNNGWMICSPYYNFIEPVANGYICKTGFLYNDQVSADEDYNVDPRFIILDARLKPVSMLDFYDFESVEDLGFGLKVCTDKGCMFVTYDYQPVTNDEWTDFKLTPDGRLMAIGKIVQHKGTDGNPFDPQIADGIVSYFEIPKK